MVCCGWIPISWEAAMALLQPNTQREKHTTYTRNFRRPTAQKAGRKRKCAVRLWSVGDEQCVSLSLKILKSRTRRIHLCAASLTSIQQRLRYDDGADLEKAPLHFHAPKWATQATATLWETLTDWRTAGTCLHLTEPEPSTPNQLVSAHLNHYWHWS